MADNVELDAGSGGAIVATDDVSSVQHQLVKIEYGTDGVATMVSASNPLPTTPTNLEKAEDAAHSTGDKGIMSLGVRKDTAAALAGTDGDYQPFIFDANGALWVVINGLQKAEDAAHSSGDLGVMALAVRKDSAGTLVSAEGDYTSLLTDANGNLWTFLSGTTSLTPGTAAANLGKAEDAAHTSGDVGVMMLCVRQDTAAALGGTDGDYMPPIVNSTGHLYTTVNGVIPGTTATSLGKAEDAAHTTGDTGVMMLGVRKDSVTALAGSDGDYIPPIMDANGALWVFVNGTTTLTPGTGASNLGKAEDAGHTTGDVGVMALCVRADTQASLCGADADYAPAQLNSTGAMRVQDVPHTSGGLTPYKLVSAATTNATSVKASAGMLYNVQCFNLNASARYLKIYDKASAPTVGSDTPVKVIMIPGNTAGSGVVLGIDKGVALSNGLAFALTTGIADSDNTAVAANEIVVNLDYK